MGLCQRGYIPRTKRCSKVFTRSHCTTLQPGPVCQTARCCHKNLVEFIRAVPGHPAIIVIEMMDCILRLQLALTNERATPNHIHLDVAQGLIYLHIIQPCPIIRRDVSVPNAL